MEKQRPTPIPTLSSKLSRQEASLSDLAGQLRDIHSRLARLSDVPSRLAALEMRYQTMGGTTNGLVNLGTASTSMPPPSALGYTPSPLQTTGSIRDNTELTPREEEETDIVHDFENTDMNTTSLMSEVRVYRSASARPGKRKRVEEEPDAWKVAFDMWVYQCHQDSDDSFTSRCLPAVNFFDRTDPEFTADTIRDKSPLLFWAVIAVGSRETPDLYDIFLDAQDNTMELLRHTLGGPKPTYWDLCGAMVWNKWLAPVRPIGKSSIWAPRNAHARTRGRYGI